MKNEKSVVVLKGEGSHVHELVGDFSIKNHDRFSEVYVNSKGELNHIHPITKKFAEHNSLVLKKGLFIQGRQMEFNYFTNSNDDIWD